ncbi:hypothetical protein B0J17DRAFT_717585 [Rhizoctonia solani]|nr:hypothetical protein B0J17DRAFT_717585 [Rhizoctonia solani]
MSEEPVHVFGTLPFASLNAHEKDSHLAYHDDLGSLTYTLLWLLRGRLPWSHYAKNGTRVGRIRQFGELVDCARSLLPNERPDYVEWQRRFKQIQSTAVNDVSLPHRQDPQPPTVRLEPPIEAGQVVLVKLDSSVTADGYTMREGHESSFIPDPTIDGPEWSTVYHPAVVAQVEWGELAQNYHFLVIAISRSSDSNEGAMAASHSSSRSNYHC